MKSLVLVLLLVGAVFIVGVFTRNDRKTTTSSENPQSASIAPTKATPTATTPTLENSVMIEGGNFYFAPNEIRAKKGKLVTIRYTSNNGLHDFVIVEFNIASDTISTGQTTTISFTPDKIGTFEFYCSIGRHRELGMKGTLIVEE